MVPSVPRHLVAYGRRSSGSWLRYALRGRAPAAQGAATAGASAAHLAPFPSRPTPRSAGLRGVFDHGRNPLLTPRAGSPASSRPQSGQSGHWYEQPTRIVSPKTTTRSALAARPSFGRLPRDRYYHHYVPPSNGMRRPGFAAEKPYRLRAQPSFLTKDNLRLLQ